MNPLSDRINKLSTSQTLAMAALARELKSQGKDIILISSKKQPKKQSTKIIQRILLSMVMWS